MLSSNSKTKNRTGKSNVGRFEFLSQLVNEFKSTQSLGKLSRPRYTI